MTAFFPEEITEVRVSAKGYGQQDFSFGAERFDAETKIVRLRPVGRIKGRISGNPDAVRHRQLQITSFSPPDDPMKRAYSRTIVSDANGQFEIPEIAVGQHGVSTLAAADSST